MFAPSRLVLITGAFLMQFAVQDAWGVVPVHLAELSHDSVRGFIPGFAYQTAGVIAGSVVYMEALYAQKTSYATAMALVAASAFVMASVVTTLGTEKRGQKFGGMA
jgi:MFS transporter, SHS family, lactate transporter